MYVPISDNFLSQHNLENLQTNMYPSRIANLSPSYFHVFPRIFIVTSHFEIFNHFLQLLSSVWLFPNPRFKTIQRVARIFSLLNRFDYILSILPKDVFTNMDYLILNNKAIHAISSHQMRKTSLFPMNFLANPRVTKLTHIKFSFSIIHHYDQSHWLPFIPIQLKLHNTTCHVI